MGIVFANTFVGAYVRFWSFTRGDSRLRGFWNGADKDRFEHYRDVGLNEHAHDIQSAIEKIKSMPVRPLRRGQVHAQIGAVSGGKRPATYSYPVPMGSACFGQPSASSAYPAASTPPMGPSLRDEDYVDVTLVEYGRDMSNHVYRFQTPRGPVEKLGSEFEEGIDPRGNRCMVYYGRLSGIYFWTVSLEPENQFVQVDIKKERA